MAIFSTIRAIWSHPVVQGLRLFFHSNETVPDWMDSTNIGNDPNHIADYYRREDGSWYRYLGDPSEPFDPYWIRETNEKTRRLLDDAVKKFIYPYIGDANRDGIPDIHQSRPNTDPWKTPFGGAEALVCPVILDLDGNGIQTLSTANGVYFDNDQDGFAEKTGWVGGNDGLLVYDRNGKKKTPGSGLAIQHFCLISSLCRSPFVFIFCSK